MAMKKTTADAIKSVIVMLVIGFVCVLLLAVANEYLKYEAVLDEKMARELSLVCPTGDKADDETLSYFETVSADELIKKVNKEHKKETVTSAAGKVKMGQVLAVYRAVKGENAGSYIVQAQADCSYGTVIMLTAYDKSGKIIKTKCYSQTQSYWDAKIAGKHDDFIGLIGKSGVINGDDIAVGTGATYSIGTVAAAVTISDYMAAELLTGGESA